MPNQAPQTRSFVQKDRHGQWFMISTAQTKDEMQVSEEWLKSTHTYTVKP